MTSESNTSAAAATSDNTEAGGSVSETLIVVSKVKRFIRETGQLNTSECCIEALSKKIADEIVKGIAHAKADGRKTLMGRDIGVQ